MFAIVDIFYFVAGGALIWFCRDPVTRWYKGAEDYWGALKDKAEAALAAVKK